MRLVREELEKCQRSEFLEFTDDLDFEIHTRREKLRELYLMTLNLHNAKTALLRDVNELSLRENELSERCESMKVLCKHLDEKSGGVQQMIRMLAHYKNGFIPTSGANSIFTTSEP